MAYSVLVVDDSLIARGFMERALRLSGLPLDGVYTAANGKEALQLLEKHRVDFMFADLHMPEMNGIELVRALRSRPALQGLPVTMVSMDRSRGRRRELEACGVQLFLTKPVTPEELKQAAEKMCPARTARGRGPHG